MLINLSSLNEADPARFKNDFFDSIVIKKNSFICLVKAQIIRTKEQKQISIPPNTEIYVRWTAYDVGNLTLNSAGTANLVLSISGFVTYINGLWNTLGFPAGYVIEALVDDPLGTGNDERLQLKFVANEYDEAVIDFRWKDEVYFDFEGVDYWTTNFGQCLDNAGSPIAFPPVPNAPNTFINDLYSQAAAMAAGVQWDTATRTTPTNQVNGSSFSMLTTEILSPTEQNGYTPMQFFINQQNVNLSVAFGVSTSSGTPVIYATGPYIGNNNYDPGTALKSNILALEFDMNTQGRLDNKLFNNANSQFETNTVDYDPGDYFEIYPLVDHEGAIDMDNPQRAFYMNVNHFKTGGLIMSYQGNLGSINDRPGNNNFFYSANTTQPITSANVMNNMCHPYGLEHLKEKYYKQDRTNLNEFLSQWDTDLGYTLPNGGASWLTNSVLGARTWKGRKGEVGSIPTGAGWVYNQSLGRPATKQFAISYEDNVSDNVQYRYSGSVWGFNDQNGVQRGDGSDIEIPTAFRVFTDPLPMSAPTMITGSFNFNSLAETMIPAALDANLRTIIGGDTGNRLLEIQLNQTEQFYKLNLGNNWVVSTGGGAAFQSVDRTEYWDFIVGYGGIIQYWKSTGLTTWNLFNTEPVAGTAAADTAVITAPGAGSVITTTAATTTFTPAVVLPVIGGAGFDVRLTQTDSSVITGELINDNDKSRIHFRSSNNTTGFTYNVILTYTGVNNNRVQLQVVECELPVPAGTTGINSYNLSTGGTITPTQALMAFNSIGGINPLTDPNLNNYNDYSPLTYIANIRIFQKNLRVGNAPSMWNIESSAMVQAYENIPGYLATFEWFKPGEPLPAISFYPYSAPNFVVPTIAQGSQDQYNNVGFPNSTQNLGVFISKGATNAPTEPSAPVLNNLFVPANQLLRNSQREVLLSTEAYASIGQGLVEIDTPVGRGIDDILDFELPDPDANGNIIQVPRVLAPDAIPPNDWTSQIIADVDVSLVDNEAMNVEITNLTHRTLNGASKSWDKTIYQIPTIAFNEEIGNQEVVEFAPPSKVWIPLDNAMEIPLNKLDVLISTVDGLKVETLHQETNISIQIEDNVALLN